MLDRTSFIGGSDIPVILGLSSYKTPYVLYLEKTGTLEETYEETEQQYWGKMLEPVIREHFAKKHNVEILQPETIRHPICDYLRANLDGYAPELDAVLEIKCSDKFMRGQWGDEGTDVIPMTYLTQGAHYALLKDSVKTIFPVLIGGNEYREFTYIRDPEIETMIFQAANDFWSCVKSGTPPDPINIDDMKLKYNQTNPEKFLTVTQEISSELMKLADVKAKIKELNELEKEYRFQIMNHMKDSECLIDESGKPLVTWKANKKGQRTFLLKGV